MKSSLEKFQQRRIANPAIQHFMKPGKMAYMARHFPIQLSKMHGERPGQRLNAWFAM
jgi:hypothetical protein